MNYIEAIVNILEPPQQIVTLDNNRITKFRAQLPQAQKIQIVHLIVWGNLGEDISQYSMSTNYMLIEGYLSSSSLLDLESNQQFFNKIEITVLDAYPLFFRSNSI